MKTSELQRQNLLYHIYLSVSRQRLAMLLLLLLMIVCQANAQRVATVRGKYTYTVGDNDNITLKEAKLKCVELAKAEAIKAEFGELITSDVIDTNVNTNGENVSSYFWENTVAMAKGDWLGDIVPPHLTIEYVDGKLVFTAEVNGKAREIVQAKTDIRWTIQKLENGKRVTAKQFDNKDRIYIDFSTPSDGYLAVYLIVGDDETSCLLPYPKDFDGRFPVKSGRNYLLFDKESDNEAIHYRLNTSHQHEDNQIVVIYSPNPFTKCNDVSRNTRQPNVLNTHDFQKWLLRCQRADPDMVVDKRWIRIVNRQ